ncbi:MAG TPA: hypothetical protein VN729_09170 [Ktedonobacteraceae bacterium]|nr:hypothetical protein [Ktedonobacteraceae bacterium]
MITQAIKDWLHKMFAWWPWKKSTPLEYQYVASAVTSGSAPETSFWVSKEGTVPQAGATPRRFTLENRAERLAQLRPDALDLPPLSPQVAALKADVEAMDDYGESSPHAPTAQQRLEFLRYLVQQGIVNEGFENDPPATSG